MVIFSEEYQDFLMRADNALGSTIGDRLLWLMAEVGEASDAYMGMYGANPRKGVTHNKQDVADELADVAMTALAAIVSLELNPEYFMARNQQKVERRLRGT